MWLTLINPRIGQATSTGLILRDGISFAQWQDIGGG